MSSFFIICTAFAALTYCSASIISGSSTPPARDREIISSPRITNWGDWSDWSYCPKNMWVIGTQLKIEKYQGDGPQDDSGMDALKLLCAPLGKTETYNTAQPAELEFGDWQDPIMCGESIMIGFELLSESNQGSGDDTAANNLRMKCSDRKVVQGAGVPGKTWGSWTGMQACPTGYAVCGLRTQVERNQGHGDDSGLNNIDMSCCKMAADDCTPSDQWQVIQQCDNKHSSSEVKCAYEKRTGTSTSTTDSTATKEEQQRSMAISSEVGVDAFGVSTKFSASLGTSATTGYEWSHSTTSTFESSTTSTVEMIVPAGVSKRIEQVVGICGPTSVFTPTFRFTDI